LIMETRSEFQIYILNTRRFYLFTIQIMPDMDSLNNKLGFVGCVCRVSHLHTPKLNWIFNTDQQ